MDEKMLASFASPVLTKGWNGRALAPLVFTGKSGTRRRSRQKFSEEIISTFGASQPQANELYTKLNALERGSLPSALALFLSAASLSACSSVRGINGSLTAPTRFPGSTATTPLANMADMQLPASDGGMFVNRELEVDTVFELLFANVVRARHVAQKNTYPLNIAVAAQNLGTGKTAFAFQLRDIVTKRSPRFDRLPYSKYQNLATQADFDVALGFKTLYVNLSHSLLVPVKEHPRQPQSLADWLQWAIVSCAAAQLPELQLRYEPGQPLVQALWRSQPLFIVLDEIDTITRFPASGAHPSVYYDFLELLKTQLNDLPHLVYCAGVSADLLEVGRRLRVPVDGLPTPSGLKVNHV
jgi:hypothetical protein